MRSHVNCGYQCFFSALSHTYIVPWSFVGSWKHESLAFMYIRMYTRVYVCIWSNMWHITFEHSQLAPISLHADWFFCFRLNKATTSISRHSTTNHFPPYYCHFLFCFVSLSLSLSCYAVFFDIFNFVFNLPRIWQELINNSSSLLSWPLSFWSRCFWKRGQTKICVITSYVAM